MEKETNIFMSKFVEFKCTKCNHIFYSWHSHPLEGKKVYFDPDLNEYRCCYCHGFININPVESDESPCI